MESVVYDIVHEEVVDQCTLVNPQISIMYLNGSSPRISESWKAAKSWPAFSISAQRYEDT